MSEQDILAVEPDAKTVYDEQSPETVEVTPEAPEGDAGKPAEKTEPSTEEAALEEKRAKRREEKKARRDHQRKKLADLEAENAALKAKQDAVEGVPLEEPKEADFDDFTEYAAAKAVWKHEDARLKRESGAISKQLDAGIEKRKAEIESAFVEQVEDARERFADFDAVAFNPSLAMTDEMAELVKRSDVAADLAYHLGSNPHVAADIAAQTPVMAAMALGRLEASLTPPEPLRKSKAPEPISPVGSKGSATKDPSKMNHQEYVAWRNGTT